MNFLPILFISFFVSFNVQAASNDVVEKPFSIGFGYYGHTVSYTDSLFSDDKLSGTALSLGYSVSDEVAFRASFFSLDHDDFSAIESSGYDLVAYYGQGFASPGLKVYIGGGLFKDEWKIAGFSTTFDGLQLSMGVGNDWETISIDFVIGIRDAGDYEDFIQDTLLTNVSATAISTMLTLSARF